MGLEMKIYLQISTPNSTEIIPQCFHMKQSKVIIPRFIIDTSLIQKLSIILIRTTHSHKTANTIVVTLPHKIQIKIEQAIKKLQ